MGASAGCSLAALNFEHFGNRGVRLYYESEDSMIREACWDSIHDKYRNDASPYLGGYRLPTSMGSSVSGAAWKADDLEMRLYLGGKDCIFEHRYTGGWTNWCIPLQKLLPERQISVLRGDSGIIHIFFVEGDSLVEVQRSHQAMLRTPILSKLVCSGPGCPGVLGRGVPHSFRSDAISRSPSASATTEVDGRHVDGIEVLGKEVGTQESEGQENNGQEDFRQESYEEVDRQGYVSHEHTEREDVGQEEVRQEDDGRENNGQEDIVRQNIGKKVDGQSVAATEADPDYSNVEKPNRGGATGGQPDQQEPNSIQTHGHQSVDAGPTDEEHTTVVSVSQAQRTNADGQAQQQPPSTNLPEAEVNTQPPQDDDSSHQGESGWLRFKRQWKRRVARYCCYCC